MVAKVNNFLTRHRISVLSILLPDGTVHGATCHFVHTESPFQIIFVTEQDSRKVSGLLTGQTAQAAVTVGFSEEEWVELQMSGTIKLVTESELVAAREAFEAKFGGDLKSEKTLLIFIPAWWRFTEFKRADAEKIESGK